VLNDERENRKLLSKLPEWLANRWGRIVVENRRSKNAFPPFVDFMKFVVKEADIACDPVTSFTSLKLESQSRENVNPNRYGLRKTAEKNVFSTGVKNTPAVKQPEDSPRNKMETSCRLCKRGHVLDVCNVFMSKPLQDRKQFAIENQLCFGCLNPGHRSRYCQKRLSCRTCSKLHATALHGDIPSIRKLDDESLRTMM
jgi:hypothetical protein